MKSFSKQSIKQIEDMNVKEAKHTDRLKGFRTEQPEAVQSPKL